MKALEKGADVRAAMALWREGFKKGAQTIGTMAGQEVRWHENPGIWGMFGRTHGRGGIERSWNPFGQMPFTFRNNMIVEINPPPNGIDQNLRVFLLSTTVEFAGFSIKVE